MDIYFFVLYCLYGLCIGSFLNVVIYRLPLGIPMAKGRSFCPGCNHQLSALDLVPVFSFLFLGGKCRYCKEKISFRYPAIELLTGLLYGISFLRFGLGLYSVAVCLILSVLLSAAMIDFDSKLVPDRFHVILFVLALLTYIAHPVPTALNRILGGAIVGGILFLVAMLTHGGIGGGDIKLMSVMGLILGLAQNILVFFLAYVFAALFCIKPLLKGEARARTEVPMVPFFALSSFVALFFGDGLLQWYFSLFI